ncbi:hypothetical protein [Chitinophaga barathri]|uniref:DUF3592 domain-containing protein n=1 Tax=Chitinophaga barathri TaxID=1647451 RepID=A0A3N4MCZ8_9BACT|nr:hypothetical protein [Chitinophaga barathri]RPD41438.1 hypothetical protein EG028_08955 [Chitinophaga barathri]
MFSNKAAFIVMATGMSLIFLGLFGYFGMETFVRYFGSKTDALVTMPAFNCDDSGRYGGPKIIVDVNGEAYELYISGSECNSGKYDRGKIVKVLIHPLRNDVVMESSHPEIYFGIMVLLLGFSIYAAFLHKESPKVTAPSTPATPSAKPE